MKIQSLVMIVLAVVGLSGITYAESANSAGNDGVGKRRDFTRDVTHTTGNGKTFTRHTEQVSTDDGYERHTTATNPKGETATRDIDVSVDRENRTLTKERTSTDFKGRTRSSTVVKTLGGTAKRRTK